MKQSNILVPSLLALTLPLSAMAHHGSHHFEQGFYVGGAAGLSKLDADINQTLEAEFDGVTGAIKLLGYEGNSTDADRSVGMGQIQLGYAIAWEWLFVGLEVSVNGSSLNVDQHNSDIFYDGYEGLTGYLTSDINVELNNFEPVADLKLGFNLRPRTYLYARVGAAFNNLEVTDHVTFSQNVEGPPFEGPFPLSQGFAASDSDSVVGLRLGAGIEHKFYDHVSVALDYVHTDYGSVSASGAQDTRLQNPDFDFPVAPQIFVYDKVDVVRDVVTLGINYYFW